VALNKVPRAPLKVSWEVINTCDSRCLACSRWRDKPAPGMLDTDSALDIIRQLADLGVIALTFTGGEPALREDLPLLLKKGKEAGLNLSMSTNGLALAERGLDEIVSSGLDTLSFSLDGACAKTHDELRGKKGSFEKVRDAVQACRRIRREGRPKIFINTTVVSRNLPELPALCGLCRQWEVDGLTLQPAQSFSEVGFSPSERLSLLRKDTDSFQRILLQISSDYPGLVPYDREVFQAMALFCRDPGGILDLPCYAGTLFAQIDPEGMVFSCPAKFAAIGNLKEERFSRLWKSSRAQALRERIRKKEHPPCAFNCILPMNLLVRRIRRLGFFRSGLFSHARSKLS